MSLWHPRGSFQPETLDFVIQNETWLSEDGSVQRYYSCQCVEYDKGWRLCEFHEGFDCGVEHMKGRAHASDEEPGSAAATSG